MRTRAGRSGKGDLLAMLAGTLLIGLSGYVFLALIGHGRFDAATTAALSVTYLLGNVLGPGIFVAVEQETSRVVSDGLTRGGDARPMAHRMSQIDSGLGLATLLVLAALTPLLLSRVLDEQVGLILALGLAVVGSAAVFLIRGLTGGQRRFRVYAGTVLIDGATRILGCAALVLLGSTDPVAYGLALCAGPAVSAALTGRRTFPPATGRPIVPTATSRLTRDVGLLLIASGLAMAMANLAPVVVTALLPDDPATAAGFAGAVVLTRVPLLFMGTIQALLLPGMTAAAAIGDRAALRGTIGKGLALIAGVGVVGVIATAVFGRPLIAMLFGDDRDTTSTGLLMALTASAALFMAMQLLQPAMVALRRHRALVVAWSAGAMAFVASFAVPIAPVDRGVLAQIAGPTVTLTLQLAVISRYLRRPVPAASSGA